MSKKVVKFLEENGFVVYTDNSDNKQDKDIVIEFGRYTPEGEDWYVCLFYDGTFDGFMESLSEYVDGFDIDEEASIWIEQRGKNGVPDSIKSLVEDAEWKLETLEKLLAKGSKK